MKKILLFMLVIGAALAAWFLYLQDHLPEFMDWVRGQGLVGALIVGLVYVVATVLMIPGSLITLMIGAIYGPWLGTAVVSPASVVGATVAFLLGRSVFRSSIEQKMGDNPKFSALTSAVEKEGLKIITLVRLSPIFPFSVVNYAFGLTRAKLSHYVLGSFAGMLPGTLMYVYLGAAVGDITKLASDGLGDTGTAGLLMKYGGLAATVVVTVFVTKAAKKALAEAAPDAVAVGEEN
ncbi:MAG: TVP38/TMEM64 family protein [Planctomycetota bacterium]|nr:TVP38/TMEM64 family protein [Planctomycetota bacterium]MDA1114320.1 TVP38/TMEM64 family protein [Planctomycetota bacterium]